jgi:uncharacterized membrane protein YqjE
MNPPTPTAQAPEQDNPEAGGTSAQASPTDLIEALLTLVEARLGLIQLESAEAGRIVARRITSFAIACACLLFAWILLLTASIQLIAEAGRWSWSAVAVAVAILHLLVGIFFARSSKPAKPCFLASRTEFKKDREWILKLTKKKSNV